MISREQAEAIIREQVVQTIFQDAPKSSTFLSMARKLPNMTSNQTRMRVLDFLPTAYWVSGDTGIKQTSTQAWDNVFMTAAELAVIVPIPDAVMADAEFDIFGQVTPRINEAIGQRVDSATIFGVNRPAEWDLDIVSRARQAGNNVANNADLYASLLGVDGVWDKVESAGYSVNGAIARPGFRAALRDLRDEVGNPLFKTNMQGGTQYSLDGTPLFFPTNGAFDSSIAQLVVGDFTQAVYAIRQDITVKILTEATIIDPGTKEIIYSLAQQDMSALRVVFRMGWALPNPATRMDESRVTCPFAYLEPATPVTTQAVTITVTDGTNPISGAIVTVEGARKKANASGVAVFNLRAGSYDIKAQATGHRPVNDSVTVASAAVAKTIALTAN